MTAKSRGRRCHCGGCTQLQWLAPGLVFLVLVLVLVVAASLCHPLHSQDMQCNAVLGGGGGTRAVAISIKVATSRTSPFSISV